MREWKLLANERPEKGRLIEWISEGGIEDKGKLAGGGIFYPEGSDMYIYYDIKFWRYM